MSYLGGAANAVGGELQGWAAVLEKQAMFDEYQKELKRQRGYRAQGADIFGQALGYASPATAQQQLAQGKQQRIQRYNAIEATPLGVNLPNRQSTNASRDVASERLSGESQATLGSYSDWAVKQAIASQNYQQQLNRLSSFAGGTASVFPYRMYQAQHSLDDLAMIGQAIASLGGGASNYAQYAQTPQMPRSQDNPYGPYGGSFQDPSTYQGGYPVDFSGGGGISP